MNKSILAVICALLFTLTPAMAAAGPFSGKTKADHLAGLKKLEASGNKSNETKDWGTCRDNCYDRRNECYDIGGDSYHCEAIYDACTKRCDSQY